MPAKAQGRLQGVARLIGPTLFAVSFALAIDGGRGLPGTPFLLAGVLLLAALALGWRVTR